LLYTSKINITTKVNQEYYFGLMACLVIAFGLFLNAIQPGMILTDGGIFSAITYKIMNGGTLYVDAWENKPPGIFYLMAIFFAIIPSKVYAVYIMSGVFFLATSYLIYTFIYNVFQSLFKSVLFCAIALIFTIYPNNVGDGLYTEIYGTFFILLSFYFWDIFKINQNNKYALLSTLVLGFTFWFKEPFIIICIPIVLYYLSELKYKKQTLYLLLSFITPSLLFIIILLLTGSLGGFLEMIIYNYSYFISDQGVPIHIKFNDLYQNYIDKLKIIFFIYFILLISKSEDPNQRLIKIFWFFILISSSFFYLMTPYNFGHYYYSFYVLFFIAFIKTYQVNISKLSLIKTIMFPVLIWIVFQLSKTHALDLSFNFKTYQADVISKRLSKEKDKSLFVDCVEEGGFYIKGNMLYNTSFPVALPVHFSNNKHGMENRNKIWNELSNNPPNYIIKNYTTSFFYWHIPHNGYYDKQYNIIDSTVDRNKNKIYLLVRKHK
jgi:hypothetical protein